MAGIYCERGLAAGLAAEPLNALTNLAFLVAAWFAQGPAFRLRGPAGRACWDVRALVLLVYAIGLGSGAWHTLATRWAELMDVVPIGLFMMLYVASFVRRRLGASWVRAVAGVAAFLGLGFAVGQVLPPTALNGSVGYLPAWLTLGLMGAWTAFDSRGRSLRLLAAFALFTCSVTFRSVDQAMCEALSIGTHWLWHVANAGVLYLAVTALTQPRKAPGPAAAAAH